MLNYFRQVPIYIKVFENKIEVRLCSGSGKTASTYSHELFSSKRSLVASFSIAEKIVKETIDKVFAKNFFSPSSVAAIQGKDNVEGGYTEVEERVLRELAYGAGCRNVIVWYGADLSDDDVLKKLKNS